REHAEMRSNRVMAVRLRTLAWAAFLVASTTHAAVPLTGPRLTADTLTALPAANVNKPLRVVARLQSQVTPPVAWARLAATGTWSAVWDAATGVPRRIWGVGILVPGACGDASIAE